MEVAETEVMRSADDDGIGIGDIKAALDDGGGDEHVIVISGKVHHHVLQVLGVHLSVPHSDTRIRNILSDQFLQFGQSRDTVVDDKHLPVATHLKVDGLGNHLRRESMHFSLNGIAIRRRCLNHTKITGTHE